MTSCEQIVCLARFIASSVLIPEINDELYLQSCSVLLYLTFFDASLLGPGFVTYSLTCVTKTGYCGLEKWTYCRESNLLTLLVTCSETLLPIAVVLKKAATSRGWQRYMLQCTICVQRRLLLKLTCLRNQNTSFMCFWNQSFTIFPGSIFSRVCNRQKLFVGTYNSRLLGIRKLDRLKCYNDDLLGWPRYEKLVLFLMST